MRTREEILEHARKEVESGGMLDVELLLVLLDIRELLQDKRTDPQ